MATYVLLYKGGRMAETDEERQKVMAAWGKWFGELGQALVDGGNPFGPSSSVGPDGTVKQGAQTVGKLQLAAFKDTSAMVKRGYSYFATGETPSAAADCSVLQGASENSNVPVAESAIRLVGLTRQFEMLNKAVSVCGQMGQQAVQELGKVTG